MFRKAIFCSLLLTVAVPVYGDQRAPQQAEQVQKGGAFSDDEKRQALEALKTIADSFGTTAPQQAPAAATQGQQPAKPEKTMAEVADKALDISTKYIGQVAAILEKAAPHVWRIMVKQQYAKAIGSILGPFLWILTVPTVAAIVRHFWRLRRTPDIVIEEGGKRTTRAHNCNTDRCTDCSSSDERACRVGITLVAPAVITVIAAGFFIAALADSAMYLVNPEYYAIKDLVTMLLHGGM